MPIEIFQDNDLKATRVAHTPAILKLVFRYDFLFLNPEDVYTDEEIAKYTDRDWYALEYEGHGIGFIMLHNMKNVVELVSLAIKPKYRTKQIFEYIEQFVKAYAENVGKNQITLCLDKNTTNLHKMAKRYGFAPATNQQETNMCYLCDWLNRCNWAVWARNLAEIS